MGLVHIYCGDGKGKTSAAVGLAVRAAGCGKRVVIARFLKTDNSGEVEILKKIPEVTLIPCRKTFGFVRSMDEETKRECAAYHRELFGEAVKLAEHADLVVFDEIMAAVNYGMVPERDVLEFLENRPGRDQTDGLEIVLTGRDPSEKLIAAADYVSEICKRKHPFDRGIMARRGVVPTPHSLSSWCEKSKQSSCPMDGTTATTVSMPVCCSNA